MRIGELLIRSGHVSPEQLSQALSKQEESGGRLGELLMHGMGLSPWVFYRTLARHHKMHWVNLMRYPSDKNLLSKDERVHYQQMQMIPWRIKGDKLWIAVVEKTEAIEQWAEEQFPGQEIGYAQTTPRDIKAAMAHHFGDFDVRHASSFLKMRYPQFSSVSRWSERQSQWLIVMALIIASLGIVMPQLMAATVWVVLQTVFMAALLFKCMLTWKGRSGIEKPHYLLLEDQELPPYLVLVPLYRESEKTLSNLVRHLSEIEYPAHLLDIKLITEADDDETRHILESLSPPAQCDMLSVPSWGPRTKPKACNYALRYTRFADKPNTLVTIYDAEDWPHPQQLRRVAGLFRSHAWESNVCVQAPLNYYNAADNMLTAFFSLEYYCWFNLMLPGMVHMQLPVPLGGTSNHMRLRELDAIGGWDPYNVTEDADLGIRIARAGGRTLMVADATMEEAPGTLGIWMKQRARWVKGYMQSWWVHMRQPVKLYNELGWKGFWAVQLFVGAPPVVFLLGPVCWILSLLGLTDNLQTGYPVLNQALYVGALLMLGCGVVLHLWQGIMAYKAGWGRKSASRLRKKPLQSLWHVLALVAFPLYWLAHSVAAYVALWQFLVKPHHWDKTPHG